MTSAMQKQTESPYKVEWSYLPQQFANIDPIIKQIREFIPTGDFTIGKRLTQFEHEFAEKMGTKYAIGVSSGTDAIKIALKAQGVGFGDEVITASNTFIATVGAINELGAKTVFVDCTDDFCMDINQLESAITSKTKAILPVHLTGQMTNMPEVMRIAKKHNLAVVEDACQAMFGEIDGQKSGTFAPLGCFSLHPLKAINVWGDGGMIITNDDDLYQKINQLRNHGLVNRDEVECLGYNSRLDTLQAIVGSWLLPQADFITSTRIKNAGLLDSGLSKIDGVRIPPRYNNRKLVYHLYILFVKDRDALLNHCIENGIEAKIHYPIALYQQKGLRHLGYKPGDFPVTDRHTKEMISLPLHQYHTEQDMQYMIDVVRDFYAK